MSVLLVDGLSPAVLAAGDDLVSLSALPPADNVFALDGITSCSLVPTRLTNNAGAVLASANASASAASAASASALPGVIIQGGTITALGGVVTFPAAAVTARLGAIISGELRCAIGRIASPTMLPWTISMASCPLGSAPVGTDGASTSRPTVRAPLVRWTKSGAVIHGTLGFSTTSPSNANRAAGATDSAHAGVILTATRRLGSVIVSRSNSPRPLLVNVPWLTYRS
jgi:hypothetical protein